MEGIGTFFLTLAMVLATARSNALATPWAAGSMLAAMTLAGRNISGAHFNPAVSLANLIQGRLDRRDILYYLVAQLLGAVLSMFIAAFLWRCDSGAEIIVRTNDPFCALIAEFIGVTLLAFVFLQVSAVQADAGNLLLARATGFALAAGIFLFVNVSGGLFNPAVAVAMAMAGYSAWADLWQYLLSAILGAVAAASLFRLVNGEQS